MSRLFIRVAVSLLLVLFWAAGASALDYRDYTGYSQLKTELGSSNIPHRRRGYRGPGGGRLRRDKLLYAHHQQ